MRLLVALDRATGKHLGDRRALRPRHTWEQDLATVAFCVWVIQVDADAGVVRAGELHLSGGARTACRRRSGC